MDMTQTTIDTKELKRQEIVSNYEKTMADMEERHEKRAENYYNCVDDYSFNSPYHNAADSSRENQATMLRDYSLEMLDYGYCTIKSEYSVLMNTDGTICAEGTFYGQYGSCFRLFNGGFVGVPKKADTLLAKGYTMHLCEKVYKANFTGKFSKKGNPIFDQITLVNETLTDSIESCPTNFIDWLYNQQIKTGA